MKKYCSNCAFSVVQGNLQPACAISKRPLVPTQEACASYISNEAPKCPVCGNPIPPNSGFITEDLQGMVCNDCGLKLYSCATCLKASQCAFNNYAGPLDKVVIRQAVQNTPFGQQIIQTQAINPEVQKICCGACECRQASDEEPYGCRKQTNLKGCEHWEFKGGN